MEKQETKGAPYGASEEVKRQTRLEILVDMQMATFQLVGAMFREDMEEVLMLAGELYDLAKEMKAYS